MQLRKFRSTAFGTPWMKLFPIAPYQQQQDTYCFTRARTQRHGCICVCLDLSKVYIGQGFRKRETSLCVFCISLRFVLIVQLFPYDAKFANRAHARQHSPSRNMANISSPASD